MTNYNFEKYSSYKKLPPVAEGDIVHLRLVHGFAYRIQVLVEIINNSKIKGEVKNIFGWSPNRKDIRGSNIIELRGKEICFELDRIHKIVPKNK